ncbi:universal stress protein [Rheinheimera muenzenbergensis]|uniref:Universal stress protein n=1 Tax=Rheinheimera muenzenbergensis TaxID=1193628 RepID=A0ABU8C1C8_9GAMM
MKQAFKHLLVIQQDAPDDVQALSRAILLAKQHNSQLTVFKSFYRQLHSRHFDKQQADDDLALFVKQQQHSICQQIRSLTKEDIEFDIIISWREAEKPALARLLSHSNISMVIKLQQRQRGLLSALPVGLEHYLISDCHLPVWLVKPGYAEQEMNILACLNIDHVADDHQLINEAILDIGTELVGNVSDQLHIINCYCNDNYSMSLPYNQQQGFLPLPDIAAEHQQKLMPYLQQHQLPATCLHLSEGLPDDEIPRTATELHSQLAIIGNSHMSNMLSAVLGDTAHYLCQHTPCDVLIVKPLLQQAAPSRLL